MKRYQKNTNRSGFTLIEMVVAVSIMAIIAGAAVPLATRMLTHKARMATEEDQAELTSAVGRYYVDTDRLPGSIADLLSAPTGVEGWTGPYADKLSTDRISGLMIQQVDAWSRPYSVTLAGDVWTVSSSGPDANFGTGDDISHVVDITFLRRERTVSRLKIVNQAINLYNEAYLTTDPLPSEWSSAFNRLVSRGYLPSDSRLINDGWSDNFRESPVGTFPVVRVESSHMPSSDSGAGSGGGSETGGGNGGDKKKKKKKKKKIVAAAAAAALNMNMNIETTPMMPNPISEQHLL
ncbi:MAG: general secretion pathway protein G, partial [Planctomycetota bacterium]